MRYCVAIKEDQGNERFVLRGGSDVSRDYQMRKQRRHFALAQFPGMALAVEQHESHDPLHVGLFGPDTDIRHPDRLTHALQKRGRISWAMH